jgi:hypothetical protein
MELLPKDLAAKLPPLYRQDGLGLQAQVVVKFFTPWTGWTWFVSEGSQEDGDWRFFGLVVSPIVPQGELGYFLLSELEAIRGPVGLRIERDLYWTPKTLAECQRSPWSGKDSQPQGCSHYPPRRTPMTPDEPARWMDHRIAVLTAIFPALLILCLCTGCGGQPETDRPACLRLRC